MNTPQALALRRLQSQPPMSPQGEAYSQACLAGLPGALAQTHARLDLAYGAEPEQVLDVFVPRDRSGAPGPLPVLFFVHGGGWSNGSKAWCSFMAPALARLPAILVCPSYRLFPTVDYPVPVMDCLQALRWVAGHADSLGADRDRIVVGGHSAGGQIAALMAMQAGWQREAGLAPGCIRGCFCVSTTFNRRMVNPKVGEAFVPPGPVEAIQPDSPLAIAAPVTTPFLITWGGAEDARLERTAQAMLAKLRAGGAEALGQAFPGRAHFDMHLDLGDAHGPALDLLARWMRKLA